MLRRYVFGNRTNEHATTSSTFSMNDGLPCRNTIGCWGRRMDIMMFLKRNYSEEELQKCFGGLPKSKLERIMDVLKSIGKEG